MDCIEVTKSTILINEVSVTRKLKVGNLYRINSSYGYAGIDSGIIRITGIIRVNDLATDLYNHYTELYDGVSGHPDYFGIDAIVITYRYAHPKSTIDGKDDEYVFHISDFADHISQC